MDGRAGLDRGEDRPRLIKLTIPFWGLAKVRLTKFKGLPRHTFHLHLKETEWRYNHRHANKYTYLLQYLRKNPLS